MLQPLRQNRQRQTVSRGVPMPAPVEGWDTSSALAAMSPKRAIVLDNLFPQAEYVEIRKGYGRHRATATAGPVETLIVYNGAETSSMWAVAGGNLHDVTNASGVAAAVAGGISGLGNSRIQYVNFTTTGGHFAWCCNGENAPFTYDGSVWAATPAITGITAADVINVNAHKSRLWLVLKNSTKVAYLATDSIGGAATTFELGGIFSMGGFVVAMGTWTRDSGDGPDDYAVFLSSRGQMAVYGGTDPSSANTWSLIGVINLGAPLGRRCVTKVGADLAIITIDGVIPLSASLSLDRGALEKVAITKRIRRAMNDAARDGGSLFGWELVGYPKGTMAILNVPIIENSTQQQFVMNTLTGAWCRFTGQNANTFAVLNDRLFFGGNSATVYEADINGNDYDSDFTGLMKTSFQDYGQKGAKKRWTMIQPLITTGSSITPSVGLDTDFRNGAPLSPVPGTPSSDTSLWNVMIWNQDVWGQSENTLVNWLSISGLGQNAAINLRVDVTGTTTAPPPVSMKINGFNLTLESGEFL